MKLIPEMIPKTSFFKNVRSLLPDQWDTLRRDCYKKANYRCEICSGKGNQHPVECHEVWEYDTNTQTQKLKRLIALCPSCHEAIHIGFAFINGGGERVITHLAKVNNITLEETEELIMYAFNLWEERNKIQWTLDISCIS